MRAATQPKSGASTTHRARSPRPAPAPARDTDRSIVGPPEHWIEALTHFALDLGFATFILTTPPDPDTLRTFIEEVAPEVRERVGAARAQPVAAGL